MSDRSSNPGDLAIAAEGGICFGQSFWSCIAGRFPSASIEVYCDRVLITDKFGGRTFEFPREKITGICRERSLTVGGIRILHSQPEYPTYIAFSSFAIELVIQGLQRFGYSIDPESSLFSRMHGLADFSWNSAIGLTIGAALSFILAILFRLQAFPFLRQESVMSAGKIVSAKAFSASCARLFFTSGSILIIIAVLMFAIQLRRHRETSSGSAHNRR